jgi:hypothetical protein
MAAGMSPHASHSGKTCQRGSFNDNTGITNTAAKAPSQTEWRNAADPRPNRQANSHATQSNNADVTAASPIAESPIAARAELVITARWIMTSGPPSVRFQ